MPDVSTILSLPLILPSQAQKHVTHNEALRILDVAVQLAVLNRTQSAPPALPALGDRHIVAVGAAGVWAGHARDIALFTAEGWQFHTPLPGWRAHVLDEGQTAVFDGSGWVVPGAGPLAPSLLGVNTTANAINRLAVSSPATLLTHEGGGHQLKVNKAANSDTASLLFQTGFSGRAEMGLAGNNDFSVKVSPDGNSFQAALTATAATGSVTLHQPLILAGQLGDPAIPSNGMIWHNAATGQIRAQLNGASRVVDSQQSLPFLTPPAGQFVLTTAGPGGAATGALIGGANRLDLYPYVPGADIVIDQAAVNCTVAVAAALAKVVIFAADPAGRPAGLLLETADMDLAATGLKTTAAAVTLRQGRTYWLGIRHSATATLSSWATTATPDINGGSPVTTLRKTLRRTVTYATPAPANFGFVATEIGSAAATAIWLRIA